jgi:hypothetical protein
MENVRSYNLRASYNIFEGKVKVKVTLEETMKAQRWADIQSDSFFNLAASWGWVVQARSGRFTPGKETRHLLCIGSWVGPTRYLLCIGRWVGPTRYLLYIGRWVGLTRYLLCIVSWVGPTRYLLYIGRWVGPTRYLLYIGSWVGPKLRKISPPPGFNPRTVQSVASNYATPAHYHHIIISSYHHIIISSYHHIILSSYHHILGQLNQWKLNEANIAPPKVSLLWRSGGACVVK